MMTNEDVSVTKTMLYHMHVRANVASDTAVNLWEEVPEAFAPGGPACFKLRICTCTRDWPEMEVSTERMGPRVTLLEHGGLTTGRMSQHIVVSWEPSTGVLRHHEAQSGWSKYGMAMLGLRRVDVTYVPLPVVLGDTCTCSFADTE